MTAEEREKGEKEGWEIERGGDNGHTVRRGGDKYKVFL